MKNIIHYIFLYHIDLNIHFMWVPLEIKIQRNELWVVCVSLRPSGADIQHLLCGISFVLIRLHCTAGQPELRAGVGAGLAAGPHRVALLPPLRRGPGRLLPGRDVRRAGGVSAPHQDLQPPPLPGGEPRRRSKYITWICWYLLHLIFIRCGSFMKNI